MLQDLTNYKYDKLVTKALAVLNKYFSSKMDMFRCGVQAQVLSSGNGSSLLYTKILRREELHLLTFVLEFCDSDSWTCCFSEVCEIYNFNVLFLSIL